MKKDKNLQPEVDDGYIWILINGLLLLIAGVVCFLVFLQFGSKGYLYIIPGAIVVIALVGAICWLALKRQIIQESKWVVASIAAWTISFIIIFFVLRNAAEHLPYMSQIPTGGLGIIYYCLVSMGIGPIIVLGMAIFLKVLS